MCTAFIYRHIARLPKGQLFTTRELLPYGSRAAVDQALCRMVKSGWIVRLARGVFSRNASIRHSIWQIARVKARAFGKQIASHGSEIARELGLVAEGKRDEHVFSVNGRSSSFRAGNQVVRLKGTGPRRMRIGNTQAGKAVKAFWHIGNAASSNTQVAAAFQTLGRVERARLTQLSVWAPAWLCSRFKTSKFQIPKWRKAS